MTTTTAVGVHIRNDVEITPLQKLGAEFASGIKQRLQRALHPPLRHTLTWMLARDEPAVLAMATIPGSGDLQQINVLTIEALSKHLQTAER